MQPRTSSANAARAREILDRLRLSGGRVRINDLAEAIGVTDETVRRNVKLLADDGLVQKFHGSVELIDAKTELSFSLRMDEEPEAKRRVAAHVASHIPNGASLFLDVGSTTAYIAQALRGHSELFIVTNSVAVAHSLAARNDNRVFMPGGELRPHDGGIFGVDALDFVGRFLADFAILSIAAIDPTNRFSIFDLEEAKYSRAIMSRAATRIVAADSSKFGRRAPIALANPEMLDLLITDKQPPEDIGSVLAELEIEVALANSLPQTGHQT
ncbi:DeoR/GlpR family DNA-binding transcription regulator [Cereibacter sphaeroides]|nr:DeoR/GlpR family DNA-binding transcription regulator [Cereibacter sphaeroides]